MPSLHRSSCSAIVRGKTVHMLLDTGPGIMRQLLKLNIHINDIDMILLSHFHLDHCAEMPPFLFATKYSGLKRTKKLTLVGGTGIKELFENLNNAYGQSLDMPEDWFQIIELGEKGQFDTGFEGIGLEYIKVCHKPESRAFRLTDETGFSIVYSGDTDYCEPLIDLAKGSDLLICESSFPDGLKTKGHLTSSLAGEIAAKACVKKLVLTHMYPECDSVDIKAQCQKKFNGQVICARDLLELE